jgi:hypothetical protein
MESWIDLFERATDCEITSEEIQDTLRERRRERE